MHNLCNLKILNDSSFEPYSVFSTIQESMGILLKENDLIIEREFSKSSFSLLRYPSQNNLQHSSNLISTLIY